MRNKFFPSFCSIFKMLGLKTGAIDTYVESGVVKVREMDLITDDDEKLVLPNGGIRCKVKINCLENKGQELNAIGV